MKFGRTYTMTIVGTSGLTHTFQYPLTMKFNVSRHNLQGLNEGIISLYNLNQKQRQDLFFDRTPHPNARMIVQAGYTSETNLSTIFNGTVTDSFSERVGVDVITRFHGYDGLYGISNAQSTSAPPLPAFLPGTLLSNKAKTLMNKFYPPAPLLATPDVVPGDVVLDPLDDTFSTAAYTPVGSIWIELQKCIPDGGDLFVDNGKVYLLSQNSTIEAPGVKTISAATGLLNIPRKSYLKVNVQMLFEPSFVVGGRVDLQSQSVTGTGYKIININHTGTISGVESGEALTELDLLAPTAPTGVFGPISQ